MIWNLLGDDYIVDTENKSAAGTLVASGQDTGISVEVRLGGPAIGWQPVPAQLYTDDSIHLASLRINESATVFETTPVLGVISPMHIHPQIVMWDPEALPDVQTLSDLGDQGVTINVFAGAGLEFANAFVAAGIWSEDQIDPSYDGSPARFITEENIAQQGFADNEPYAYENLFEEFGRPVAFELLHDAGFENYGAWGIRSGDIEELRPCLEKLVPIIQQSTVDYFNDGARAQGLVVEVNRQIDDYWVYEPDQAANSWQTFHDLGLISNGDNGMVGDVIFDRVQAIIDLQRDGGLDVPDDLRAEDLVTNEFLDDSIGL